MKCELKYEIYKNEDELKYEELFIGTINDAKININKFIDMFENRNDISILKVKLIKGDNND